MYVVHMQYILNLKSNQRRRQGEHQVTNQKLRKFPIKMVWRYAIGEIELQLFKSFPQIISFRFSFSQRNTTVNNEREGDKSRSKGTTESCQTTTSWRRITGKIMGIVQLDMFVAHFHAKVAVTSEKRLIELCQTACRHWMLQRLFVISTRLNDTGTPRNHPFNKIFRKSFQLRKRSDLTWLYKRWEDFLGKGFSFPRQRILKEILKSRKHEKCSSYFSSCISFRNKIGQNWNICLSFNYLKATIKDKRPYWAFKSLETPFDVR